MRPVDEAERWKAVGRLLGEARRTKRMSKRAAAQAAGFSEITWRNLEAGERQAAPGITVPASPRDETLEAAARAVGLDPATVFEAAGRAYSGAVIERTVTDQLDLNSKVARLSEEDREAVERIVDRLLGEQT